MTADAARALQARSASLQVSLPLQDIVEERRRVTVIFADLSGSTALASRRDPEETREILRSYFTKLGRRIQRFGGTIDKYIGDAVMAVFGAPVAHEDDAERALAAALAMRDAVDELNRELGATHGFECAVRIGVNTGEVVAGTIAGEIQAAYTVVGDTVNTAQRLEAAAASGEILVGAATRSATAHAFELEPVGPLQMKGKDQPVLAYRLIRAKAGGAPRPLALYRVTSPLVGRDAELAALVSLVWAVKAGRGGVAAVIGEAGSGKSRLIAEAKRAAAGASATWVEGRCFTLGATTRYAPFVEAITRVAGIVDGDDDALRWAKLGAAVRIAVPDDVEDTLPYLAALVGIPAPEPYAEQLRRLTSEAMGRQIFRVTRRFLTGLARRQPLVVVFEDLHWADASTAALIQHLLRAAADAPVLIIGTSRPEEGGPARELRDHARRDHRDHYTEIAVRPLRDDEAAVLIGNLLAVDELPAQMRDLIVRRAEGNPLYVEEIIRSLIEAGVVRRDETTDRWRAVTDAARIQLPDTINGLILSRIDRLNERSKEVLRYAAVIGRSFRERVLRAVVAGTDIDAVLADLSGAEIIIERRHVPEIELMFKHALIQEAVYGSILKRRRRELHARVANAIEAILSDRLDEHVGALAYHYARAEDWEKAVAYLERAGDQAGQIAADAEAVERYREALQAYDATGRAKALQLASLERKLGEALFRRGQHAEATVSLSSALRRLGAPLPTSRGGIRRAIVRALLRQVGHVLVPARLPAPRLEADAVIEERYCAYSILGEIDYFGAESERLLLLSLLLLNMGESAGYLRAIVQGQLGVGIACDWLGLLRLAGRYHERNARLAEPSGDPIAIGSAHLGLAHHEHAIGEWDASQQYSGRGTEAFWSVRELRRWGMSVWRVAFMNGRRGDPASARALAERQIEVADEAADHVLRGWGLVMLGRAQWLLGEDDAALASLGAAATILRAVPDRRILVLALGDTGYCLLRRGDMGGALKVLEEARDLMTAYTIRGHHSHAISTLVLAYMQQAEIANERDRKAWYAKADATLRTLGRQARIDVEARPALHRLRGRREWLRGRRSKAEAAWRTSLDWGERLRFLPELALTHAEIGRRTGRREHLDRALEIFAKMGASADVTRVRALQAGLPA